MRRPNPQAATDYARHARLIDEKRSGLLVDQPDQLHIPTALHRVFGQEWITLNQEDRTLIIRDCIALGGVQDFDTYRANIGSGNLQSYANVMRVRFARADREQGFGSGSLLALAASIAVAVLMLAAAGESTRYGLLASYAAAATVAVILRHRGVL